MLEFKQEITQPKISPNSHALEGITHCATTRLKSTLFSTKIGKTDSEVTLDLQMKEYKSWDLNKSQWTYAQRYINLHLHNHVHDGI